MWVFCSIFYIFASPHFDSPILRGAVDKILATPFDTCHRLRVTRQTAHTCAHYRVPYLYGRVFRRARQIAAFTVPKCYLFVLFSNVFYLFNWDLFAYKWSGCQHKYVIHWRWLLNDLPSCWPVSASQIIIFKLGLLVR